MNKILKPIIFILIGIIIAFPVFSLTVLHNGENINARILRLLPRDSTCL